MTDEQIKAKAKSLIDGKTLITISGRWALKNSPRLGRKCLERLSGGIGIALPWLQGLTGTISLKRSNKDLILKNTIHYHSSPNTLAILASIRPGNPSLDILSMA